VTARQQWSIVAAIVVVLGGALFIASRVLGDQLYPVSVGSKAPDFRASTVDSTPRVQTLADYKGQVVLLNIWGTFCLPCRDEMPAIEKLHQALGAKGLKVVAISMDVRASSRRSATS
jgi:peroxiredoxin